MAVKLSQYDAAVMWMKAMGFTRSEDMLWYHSSFAPVRDDQIIAEMKDAARGMPPAYGRLPTREDIIDMLRQITNVAEARANSQHYTGGGYVREAAIVERARKMIDSFKLPAR